MSLGQSVANALLGREVGEGAQGMESPHTRKEHHLHRWKVVCGHFLTMLQGLSIPEVTELKI